MRHEYDDRGFHRIVDPNGLDSGWCDYKTPAFFNMGDITYVAFTEYFIGAYRNGVVYQLIEVE